MSFSYPLQNYQTQTKVDMLHIAYASKNLIDNMPIATYLSEEEQQRYFSFPSKYRQLSYLLGRVATKKALSSYLSQTIPFSQFNIKNKLNGLPFIKDFPVSISISHTEEIAISVVAQKKIKLGIDIELIANSKQLSIKYFSSYEKKLLALHPTASALMKIIIWVAKEALSKLLGTGLLIWEELHISKINISTWGYELYFFNFPKYHVLIFFVKKWIIGLAIEYHMIKSFSLLKKQLDQLLISFNH